MSREEVANTSVVAMDTREDEEDTYGDHAFVSDSNHFGLPDHCTEAFHCPITKDIMMKPVVLVADGTTYEESALCDWLSENNISPLTGMELTTKEYRPNYALQHAISDYLNEKKKKQAQTKKGNEDKIDETYVGVGLKSKKERKVLSNAQSPRSLVSSDMEIDDDELISCHSDDEKRDEIFLTTNSNGNSNGNDTAGGEAAASAADEDDTPAGELDRKTAIKDAKYDQLTIFLTNIDCNEYIDVFIKEGFVSIDDLYNIRLCDFFAIGIPRGHARRLLNAIQQHRNDIANSSVVTNNNMNHQNSNRSNVGILGDPTMSIVDDGSIVDVSLMAGNKQNNNIDNDNDNSGIAEAADALAAVSSSSSSCSKSNNNSDMKACTSTQNNCSILIHPGKIPKSRNAAPLNVNVLLLGDAYVGKTSLRKRLETNEFIPTQTTQGVELTCLSGSYQNDDLQITIWDPAGQERYAPITKTFFRRAHGAAIVFSANDDSSWKHVTYWLNELETNAPDDIEVMLICNKVDLLFRDSKELNESETKQSELEDKLIKNAIEIAAQKRIPFYMTSAKSGECVIQAFEELVSQIMLNEGILTKVYEARDGVAMKMDKSRKNGNNNNDNNNDSNGKSGLLNRLRDQRRKYRDREASSSVSSSASQGLGNRFSKRVIDLSKYRNDDSTNDSNANRAMTGCCAR